MMTILTALTPAAAASPSMAIPGPFWLFTFLHWLTFTLHLAAMNFLFGGVLVSILAKRSAYRTLLFSDVIKTFPTSMAATISLGVAPLLFLQVIYGRFFYAASILQAWNWLLLIPVMLITYYLLYIVSLREKLSDGRRIGLLIAAVAGMVYVSFTFTMISDLASKPALWAGLYAGSPGGGNLNPAWLQTIFRWLHIIAGILAVAGIIIQLFTLFYQKVRGNRDLLIFGGRLHLMGLIKAAVLGIIYLFTLPREVLAGFLASPGMHAIATAIVLNIIIAVIVYRSIHAAHPRPLVATSAALTFVGLFLMVVGRHYLRLVFLQGEFDAAALDITAQWGPFALFAVTFAIGVAVTVWMLKIYFGAARKA